MRQRKRSKRGYPNAILVGIEESCAVVWKVFSRMVKPDKTLALEGARNDPKALYNFHESIINALRPTLKEGVRSVILVSLAKTSFSAEFVEHVRQHHKWLTQGANKAAFSEMKGSASKLSHVAKLTRNPNFRQIMNLTAAEETDNLIQVLEKHLNSPEKKRQVSFSLEEAEALIIQKHKPGRPKPKYLLLTDKYLLESHKKSRVHRLMQIATNKKVKTRVVNIKSPAGVRLSQLGGIVCLAQRE